MPKVTLMAKSGEDTTDGLDFGFIDWTDYSSFEEITAGRLLKFSNTEDDYWEISGSRLTLIDGVLSSGTINKFSLFQGDADNALITITGLNLSAARFAEILTSDDPMAILLVGADTITGTDGNDVLRGFAGNDTLIGGLGADVLVGGTGNNILDGRTPKHDANDHDVADYSGNNFGIRMRLANGQVTITTYDGKEVGSGTDRLIDIEEVRGTYADDVLVTNSVAGGPTRFLVGLAGEDNLTGGTGIDIARYDRDEQSEAITGNPNAMSDEERAAAAKDGGIIANLTGGVVRINNVAYGAGEIKDLFGDIDTAKSIEGVYGTSFADEMRGGAADNIFKGYGGADDLRGGSGDDKLYGNDGADELVGDGGDDTLFGGDDNDVMDGGSGYDWLDYGEEEDDFAGGIVEAVGIKANLTAAQLGILQAGQVTDSHGARDSTENIEAVRGTSKGDTIHAANLDVTSNDKTPAARDEEEWFSIAGMKGADTIIGSAGWDLLRYEQDAAAGGKAGILADLQAGTVRDGFGTIDTVSFIDMIFATNYADTLNGGVANETFVGFAGNDVIDGNGGRNTVRYDFDFDFGQGLLQNVDKGHAKSGMQGVTVNLATGIARDGLGGQDRRSDIQEVYGTRYADTMTAAATGSEFWGEGGDDTLNGGAGDDILHGGAGKNVMRGGGGNDTFFVSSRTDTVLEIANQGTADHVIASVNWTLGANIENLTLDGSTRSGTGNDLANTITGNASANILDGKAGADTLEGGKGNDTYIVDNVGDVVVEEEKEGTDTVQSSVSFTLEDNVENLVLTGKAAINGTGNILNNVITGNAGNNLIEGGVGSDTLDGGAGVDTLSYVNSGAGVSVHFYLNTVSGGHGEGDKFSNFENIIGSEFDDFLTGNDAANTLIGGDGVDNLDGGKGSDRLTGGDGADQFTFSGRSFGRDVITDFEQGSDRIAVSASLLKDYNKDGVAALADLAFAFKTAGVNLSFALDRGTSITLLGLAGTELSADDFIII